MKNFENAFAELAEEQNKYVENIKNSIVTLLHSAGINHHFFQTYDIIPDYPEHGKKFNFSIEEHSSTFEIRIQSDFISLSNVKSKTLTKRTPKKWSDLNIFKREFIGNLK